MNNLFNINNKRILFIHIPKTAGTSILSCLNDGKDFKIKHSLLKTYPSAILDSFIVFSVIRNPFDRFVSQWLYHTNYDDNFFSKKYGKNFDIFSYFNLVKQIKHETVTWKTMSEYLLNGNKKIDFLLRYENLNQDWTNFCKEINYECELNVCKKTNRQHYSKYYTPFLISKIEEMYGEDLVNFNYKFKYEKEVL